MLISLEYGFVILQMTNIGLDLILLLHFNYSCNDSQIESKYCISQIANIQIRELDHSEPGCYIEFCIYFQFVGFDEIEYM